MQKNERGDTSMPHFDDYAENYDQLVADNIKASGFPPSYFDEQKIKTLVRDFAKVAVCNEPVEFLNFGCGIGKSEKHITNYFPNSKIWSVDVSQESLDQAKARNKGLTNVEYQYFQEITELETDKKFDIIYAANVFHHVPLSERVKILAHLRTLLKPNGHFYIFEHNPVNPVTKAAFDTCEFDEGCAMIPIGDTYDMLRKAGYTTFNRHYIVFFPKPLAFMIPLEPYMDWLPIGAQYYVKTR
jgi:SAM-dependent methyltransferase